MCSRHFTSDFVDNSIKTSLGFSPKKVHWFLEFFILITLFWDSSLSTAYWSFYIIFLKTYLSKAVFHYHLIDLAVYTSVIWIVISHIIFLSLLICLLSLLFTNKPMWTKNKSQKSSTEYSSFHSSAHTGGKPTRNGYSKRERHRVSQI